MARARDGLSFRFAWGDSVFSIAFLLSLHLVSMGKARAVWGEHTAPPQGIVGLYTRVSEESLQYQEHDTKDRTRTVRCTPRAK